MSTAIAYTGYGVTFTRVYCRQHQDGTHDYVSDGYSVINQHGTLADCYVCREYAEQTAAEIRANTQ